MNLLEPIWVYQRLQESQNLLRSTGVKTAFPTVIQTTYNTRNNKKRVTLIEPLLDSSNISVTHRYPKYFALFSFI